ncbi:MAG: magnesium transporter [Gammaproteobacteria bacterium]|nr:magnesium transporter [Gammaproteobacteria bacterium]
MSAKADIVIRALNDAFLRRHRVHALHTINQLPKDEMLTLLRGRPTGKLASLWNGLTIENAVFALQQLPEEDRVKIMQNADPVHLARVLVRVTEDEKLVLWTLIDRARKRELNTLIQYPDESAGALMDPHFLPLYESLTVRETLRRIRKFKPRFTRQIYLINSEGRLCHMVELHKLALAKPTAILSELTQAVPATVIATATREEVVEQLDQHRVTDLPVVDVNGRLIGIIRYDALMDAVREESSADILTMVGASREERALSGIGFVVQKRLPWLMINLLTAFLAAAVVGLFESTIAKFTALAVLLPVVAGQSGNTGAQALAVTMRGLALREIGTSHWLRVARKEVGAGFINGIAVALVTAAGVLVWSSSVGLALVTASSMILAMVAAAFSGVIIPVMLSSLGQDPAQSSSIILTTITDVVGFFAFLGIATILSGML